MMRSSSAPKSQLAILVPYQNRKGYLDIFLREVPHYLERANGISDYAIYVAEQQSEDPFNLALSRNTAARAALDDGVSGYFVFHDVDVIPLCGVDYGPRCFNVAWFLTAGSCKVMVTDFVRANGYNPEFVGWGDEDVEFYHRLEHVGCEVREWHRMPESRHAVIVNLEWPDMSDNEALSWSRSYFGHEDFGPRFVPYRTGGRVFKRYDKSRDFLGVDLQERNHALWNQVRALSPDEKSSYIARNGLSRVRVDQAVRTTQDRIRWVQYRTKDVLDPISSPGAIPAPSPATAV
jgi:N-terminal region of glycosyl transferase group 7/N-terminal domain of galactosyltransferase